MGVWMLPGVTAEVTNNAGCISIAEYVMSTSREQSRFCRLRPPPLAREPVRKTEINAAKSTQQVYGMTS